MNCTITRQALSNDITAKVNFDEGKVLQRLNESASKAQKYLDAQVLADSNFYCPLKTGTLQKSAIINTRIGSGEIIWRTPYARAQYYGENFNRSQDPNPNARAKWFEAAKAVKANEWEKLVENAIKRS